MNQPKKPHIWHIIISTLAAAFGVQTRKNQERDFKHGNIYAYLASGVIFTLIFIIVVRLIVQAVLKSNGL